jgi:hypothetical protein
MLERICKLLFGGFPKLPQKYYLYLLYLITLKSSVSKVTTGAVVECSNVETDRAQSISELQKVWIWGLKFDCCI